MGVVQMSRGRMKPASAHLLPEPEIVARLAQATLGPRSKARWGWLAEDYDRIRDLIGRVVPGTAGYNERVRKPGGFYLPNGPREGKFTTPSGKARFTVHPLPPDRLRKGELLMMTVRSHDQYNTTIYGLEDRYRGVKGDRRVVLVNGEDLREMGLEDGQTVDVTSHFRGETRSARRFVAVAYDIPRGCACTWRTPATPRPPSRWSSPCRAFPLTGRGRHCRFPRLPGNSARIQGTRSLSRLAGGKWGETRRKHDVARAVALRNQEAIGRREVPYA